MIKKIIRKRRVVGRRSKSVCRDEVPAIVNKIQNMLRGNKSARRKSLFSGAPIEPTKEPLSPILKSPNAKTYDTS
jgi:hypothetical protein